jgi:hypothetical protein
MCSILLIFSVSPSAITLELIDFLKSYTLNEKNFKKNFAKELEVLYNSPFLFEIKYLSKPGLIYFINVSSKSIIFGPFLSFL